MFAFVDHWRGLGTAAGAAHAAAFSLIIAACVCVWLSNSDLLLGTRTKEGQIDFEA